MPVTQCPACGWKETNNNQQVRNVFSHYYLEGSDPKIINVMNNDIPVIESDRGKWLLCEKDGTPIKKEKFPILAAPSEPVPTKASAAQSSQQPEKQPIAK